MTKHQPSFLVNKSEFTKFQILFEVMRNQPHIKQKDISDKLGITTQAMSIYFKKLIKTGLLEAGSERADYHLTPKGVATIKDVISKLDVYVKTIKSDLKVEHAWIALATCTVKAGEQVGLISKEGIFYTVPPSNPDVEAIGTAISDAESGEDLGLKNLNGQVKLRQGRILIVKLPSIRKGGSKAADIEKIRAYYEEFKPDRVGVMGAVARVVAGKLGVRVDFEFGISHSSAVAAYRGLDVLVLVVGRMVNRVIGEVDSLNMRFGGNIIYEVKDAQLV
ncbi:MAG: winged helix-turn-helix transcriptional regulator [Candidatus Bathyarchaeota archaeon]|nr:winged helix-turn-helix transcriptional regulator [Candidatus Bathyarchaeota archaeon]